MQLKKQEFPRLLKPGKYSVGEAVDRRTILFGFRFLGLVKYIDKQIDKETKDIIERRLFESAKIAWRVLPNFSMFIQNQKQNNENLTVYFKTPVGKACHY